MSVDPVAEQIELAVSVQSGTARAAVLGINDGLVTNIALILGVVGASADPSVVRLAGLASLVKVVLSLRHEEIPRHLHFEQPNPYIPWDKLPVQVADQATPWPRRDGARPEVSPYRDTTNAVTVEITGDTVVNLTTT